MNINNIEKLVRLLESSTINSIELTDFWGRKVKIRKSSGDSRHISDISTHGEEQKEHHETRVEERKKNVVAIRSPIVGTFYRAPAPDAAPYVEVGDIVKPGQVVCIVEAMKLMNEIESDISGRIVDVLIENEESVEYNQELFLVEPL
jgi:acetyl-CoA carboxylase biotin carboxyl carrier protein